eukprot:TRINITY_DN2890_c3_g1::TRINITY_DN2890_c3_g1_i4::g.5822::m.5822 TRINITY_DN2890_c3_g1::TRINITY_DN2890_c3_g1_i4::g.5822  ORF type:complete len:309 (-),score=67.08,sp/Q8N283/ANR35_HUMAN/39.22/2e-11,Ank_2/PF12796.2/8.9e-18,Ank_2/PF12796.2/1.3e-16,Ank_4/PF13637.1/0.0061,Ank_4/PF13637.1/1.4e-11,Ank_4/PF13637.1/1.2e-05,Ank/PF00023.25/6.3e-05,Ank/PF00023.25/1.4e-10,Ank/PF00023.25/84,Ank_5/PF13857.1/3.2e-06,Ank_5/PF13857.1/1.7e-08,Ank_3/PF13606.1/1.5e+03,Ank_3/PF13606.1/0.0029,Ank_3/PF13606.1/1.1e-05,Ank_3
MFPYTATSSELVQAQVSAEKMGYLRPSWRKRWFVLNEFKIEYFADQAAYIYGEAPKGRFELGPTTKVTVHQPGAVNVQPNARRFMSFSKDEKGQQLPVSFSDKQNVVEIRDAKWEGGKFRTFYISFANSTERDTFVAAMAKNLVATRGTPQARAQAVEAGIQDLVRTGMEFEVASKYCNAVGAAVSLQEILLLQKYAETGTVEDIKTLADRGINIHILPDTFGTATLIQAAAKGNTSVCRYLLLNGADINACTIKGNTALHLAARENQAETIRLLLDHGANRQARNKDDQLPLHLAVNESCRALLRDY